MLKRCERLSYNVYTDEQTECGKIATHSAYNPPTYFCEECLHACMEDSSKEEQDTIKKLTIEC